MKVQTAGQLSETRRLIDLFCSFGPLAWSDERAVRLFVDLFLLRD